MWKRLADLRDQTPISEQLAANTLLFKVPSLTVKPWQPLKGPSAPHNIKLYELNGKRVPDGRLTLEPKMNAFVCERYR